MNYPNGIKGKEKTTSYSNRGMVLEGDINDTNTYYLQIDKAIIYKKPTPITIAKVSYPSRLEAVIKEAYFKTPSTTDYNGIYKGRYIDFEAKETKKDSFPLSNIHTHQITHLKKIINHGGIGFIIVRFTLQNKTFLLEGNKLFEFIENESKKSIPLSYFEKYGHIIKEQYQPRLDYLSIVDELYFN